MGPEKKVDDVMKAIQASNNDVGGRVLEFNGTEFMVRGRGYVRKPEDLEEVVLAVNEKGTPVLLPDVTRGQLGPDKPSCASRSSTSSGARGAFQKNRRKPHDEHRS